jgi:c-di-GMP-binding flagellar brake protein YcgR
MAIDPKDLAIHDDVIVETEVDGDQIRLPSFVTNVREEELWLALRLPDPVLLRLEPGQHVHLTFDRGGSLIADSEFLRPLGGRSCSGSETARVFAVRRPQGVDQVQRRAHVRVDVARHVRIRSFGSLGDHVGEGVTVNIGAGGVQFTTEVPLMFGDQLRLALVLTSRDIVVAGGPVVRIDEVPAPANPGTDPANPPKVLTRVAVRFDKISEADQERITCHILAAHRKNRTAARAPVSPPARPSPSAPADSAEPAPGPSTEPPDRSA